MNAVFSLSQISRRPRKFNRASIRSGSKCQTSASGLDVTNEKANLVAVLERFDCVLSFGGIHRAVNLDRNLAKLIHQGIDSFLMPSEHDQLTSTFQEGFNPFHTRHELRLHRKFPQHVQLHNGFGSLGLVNLFLVEVLLEELDEVNFGIVVITSRLAGDIDRYGYLLLGRKLRQHVSLEAANHKRTGENLVKLINVRCTIIRSAEAIVLRPTIPTTEGVFVGKKSGVNELDGRIELHRAVGDGSTRKTGTSRNPLAKGEYGLRALGRLVLDVLGFIKNHHNHFSVLDGVMPRRLHTFELTFLLRRTSNDVIVDDDPMVLAKFGRRNTGSTSFTDIDGLITSPLDDFFLPVELQGCRADNQARETLDRIDVSNRLNRLAKTLVIRK